MSADRDNVLEAYFEQGLGLPFEHGTLAYDRLREIARVVGSELVSVESDSSEIQRKNIAALSISASVAEYFPALVDNPYAVENTDVEARLLRLAGMGITDIEPFYEGPDPTKFDESDDEIQIMIDVLGEVIKRAEEYSDEVRVGADGFEFEYGADDSYESHDISYRDEDESTDEDSDSDEIEGATF